MSVREEQLKAGASKEWNWHPDLPVAVTPLFSWPPRPLATLRWFATNWLPITEYLIYALMAWAVWAWLAPPLEQMQTFELRMGAATVGAQPDSDGHLRSGLHLWLYGWKKQGDDYKFDRRGPAKNARIFLWNDQYWDNITYALLSGVTVWTFYDAIVWMAYANGWAPMITAQSNPIWFFALFLLLPVV